MDANSLIEGHCKFRDGKKWKTRWAVITKLSPVADCLQLQIYRDEKERARNGHTKASLSLQHFLALESGFTLDKESHTLAIICQDLSVVLAFDNRERLIQWSVRIANNLGEGHQFLVQLASAPAKSKINPGPVKMHVTDRKFCLTGGIPPRLLGSWEVAHLRRYGIVEGRLVFEGGSRCGKLQEGVHVLVPDPPQIHLIVDALDMSSKGQLIRMPSRRFGSVVDSPRKSMTSRLSEMRNMSSILPAESTTNISMVTCTSSTTSHSHNHNGVHPLSTSNRISSPTPKESRSVDELCPGDQGQSQCQNQSAHPHTHQHSHSQSHGQFWMSSESSTSRCDLDSMDTLSVMNCENGIEHHYNSIKSPGSLSPVKGQNQGQINKPLPSAMERCLSCMSKLGAQGGGGSGSGNGGTGSDVLSPSWTMDLNGVSGMTMTMTTSMSQSQVVQKSSAASGSVGSASNNSDRLSISSHGSSGGVTEFYYDTPRSMLIAEMRRNNNNSNSSGRSNTPPVPQSHNHTGVIVPGAAIHNHISSGPSGQLAPSFPNAESQSQSQSQPQPVSSTCCVNHYANTNTNTNSNTNACGGGGQSSSSPQRGVPVRNSGPSSNSSSSNGAGCGFNGCHCHIAHGQQQQQHHQTQQQSGPIYYNTNDVSGEMQGKSGAVKGPTHVNLHSGPYENYDFPRCTTNATVPPSTGSGSGSVSGISTSQTSSSQVNCCQANGSAAINSQQSCGGSNIDWSKKLAMDRSSIASSAAVSSDPMSEFYDTPRRLNLDGSAGCCCGCNNNTTTTTTSISCSSSSTTMSCSNNSQSQQMCACSACHLNSNSSQNSAGSSAICGHRPLVTGGDPLENYDVPPLYNPNNPPPHPHHSHQHHSHHHNGHRNVTGHRVNGEGKMPLVAGGSISSSSSTHGNSCMRSSNLSQGQGQGPCQNQPCGGGLAGMPIYAQVDKSKKTQRLTSNCDNNSVIQSQHIYQNAAFPPCQGHGQEPSYINLEESKSLPPKKSALLSYAQQQQQNLQQQHHQPSSNSLDTGIPTAGEKSCNYVNMDFSNSLCLYENSNDVRTSVQALVTLEKVHEENNHESHAPSAGENQMEEKNPDSASGEKEQGEEKAQEENSLEKKEQEDDSKSKPEENNEENTEINNTPATKIEAGAESSSNSNSNHNSQKDDGGNLPLRRSSSVPCKGGHANRGSASSSDSGVSGDGGLYFDDGSPLGDFGSLCLHESLPRKGQRSSPSSGGKNTSTTPTPKPQDSTEIEGGADVDLKINGNGASDITSDSSNSAKNHVYSNSNVADERPGPITGASANNVHNSVELMSANVNGDVAGDPMTLLANRHYETIEELDSSTVPIHPNTNVNSNTNTNNTNCHNNQRMMQKPKNQKSLALVSDANSTSSGASDMSDYIETLSSCSRGSSEANGLLVLGQQQQQQHPTQLMLSNNNPLISNSSSAFGHLVPHLHHHHHTHHSVDISSSSSASASPKRSTSLKPRSAKEYFKIDRTAFK